MNKVKWFLFFTCIVALGMFIYARILLQKNWARQLTEDPGFNDYDFTIWLANIDLGIISLSGVLVVVSIFYFGQNYARLKDKWRKYRGHKYESFLVNDLKEKENI